MKLFATEDREAQRAALCSLSPVVRGEGWGEGTDAPIGEVRFPADRCPLTLPSSLSRACRFIRRGSCSFGGVALQCTPPPTTGRSAMSHWATAPIDRTHMALYS